jgi:hypothetical protein
MSVLIRGVHLDFVESETRGRHAVTKLYRTFRPSMRTDAIRAQKIRGRNVELVDENDSAAPDMSLE